MSKLFSGLLIAGLLVGGCNASKTPVTGDDDDPATPAMDGGTGPVVFDDAGNPINPGENDSGSPVGNDDGGISPTNVALGGACSCDAQCAGTATHPGLCLNGVCMQQASGTCSGAGSQAECPAGSRCWGVSVGDTPWNICWPDCDSVSCAGECDADGSCVFSATTTCDNTCSELCFPPHDGTDGGDDDCPPNSHAVEDGCVCDEGFVVNADRTACVAECTTNDDCEDGLICDDMQCVPPPCTEDSCPAGSLCSDSGVCVIDIGTAPAGPAPSCDTGIPTWQCTSSCRSLVAFEPDQGEGEHDGWWDYPLNGETTSDEYRSYIRRDVMMLVQYATSKVNCLGADWEFGNGGLLGLGDMSEMDGSIPGTREGSPGHPAGTHVNGNDMDIGYYQTGTADNTLRPVCAHRSGGADAYHCTGEPIYLDPWRTALFIAHLHDNPNLRVIGVDGRVGPIIESAVTQLCEAGWLPDDASACRRGGLKLAYETTDGGSGWYYFHHHHLHISVN